MDRRRGNPSRPDERNTVLGADCGNDRATLKNWKARIK
nr:MAG TPA: hypothetical protein [Caudoviricetes sp.]